MSQRKTEIFHNYYSAKFARERKAAPAAWVIGSNPRMVGSHVLRCVDPRREAAAEAAQRRAGLGVVHG